MGWPNTLMVMMVMCSGGVGGFVGGFSGVVVGVGVAEVVVVC